MRWISRFLSALEYFIGGYLVVNGALTIIAPPDDSVIGLMHFLYGTHLGLVIAGVIVLTSGLTLVVAKLRHYRKWHGRGLFYAYLCYTFATVLNYVAYGGDPASWVGNAIGIFVVGALWLRWKFRTEYLSTHKLYSSVSTLKEDPPPLP